ncbi:MAG TPA: squalene/phytoene synthase family protein, partial [Bradyrhizobium sp.]|nr:squalene/phytoene synthase family protein [Bradyrhizobium sp.]
DWDELIHYCSYSAMPVGRFVLDVHGESTATWPASDAVCAALQINNHLQDCGKDFRELNRVYIPRDALARHGAAVEELAAPRASAALLSCLHELAAKNEALLREGETLELQVADGRLACEIAVTQSFAREIVQLLKTRDPLSERVHLGKPAMAGLSIGAIAGALWRRATAGASLSRSTPGA